MREKLAEIMAMPTENVFFRDGSVFIHLLDDESATKQPVVAREEDVVGVAEGLEFHFAFIGLDAGRGGVSPPPAPGRVRRLEENGRCDIIVW